MRPLRGRSASLSFPTNAATSLRAWPSGAVVYFWRISRTSLIRKDNSSGVPVLTLTSAPSLLTLVFWRHSDDADHSIAWKQWKMRSCNFEIYSITIVVIIALKIRGIKFELTIFRLRHCVLLKCKVEFNVIFVSTEEYYFLVAVHY